jgi:hypothetical protein
VGVTTHPVTASLANPSGIVKVEWPETQFGKTAYFSNWNDRPDLLDAASFFEGRTNGWYLIQRKCGANGKWEAANPSCSGNNGLSGFAKYSLNGNARTTFWSAREGSKSIPHPKHPDDRRADIFSFDDLVEKCSAVFEQKGCYLLNVNQIHSVDIGKECARKVIQLTFNPDVTYNMVLDRLTELNLVEKPNEKLAQATTD